MEYGPLLPTACLTHNHITGLQSEPRDRYPTPSSGFMTSDDETRQKSLISLVTAPRREECMLLYIMMGSCKTIVKRRLVEDDDDARLNTHRPRIVRSTSGTLWTRKATYLFTGHRRCYSLRPRSLTSTPGSCSNSHAAASRGPTS